MLSESTKKLIEDYHRASKEVEALGHADSTGSEGKEDHKRLSLASRELVTRCLISDDPREVIFLIAELHILLRVIKRTGPACFLSKVVQMLTNFYREHRTL